LTPRSGTPNRQDIPAAADATLRVLDALDRDARFKSNELLRAMPSSGAAGQAGCDDSRIPRPLCLEVEGPAPESLDFVGVQRVRVA